MAKRTNPEPASNAVIYARYSSHNQRDESIEQQLAECYAYARAHDMRVVAEYADRAVSGRTDQRPEFQRMMRAADKRQFQVVIAYKSNRISRNMLHALAYEDKLAKAGVSVVYVKEEFGDTAAGRFALRTMMNINQFYSENMGEDIRRGLMDNAQHCMANGILPYGYKRGDDGRFAIDEETAPIVHEIFTRLANGELKAHIAADLNRRQIRTGSGGTWGKSSFNNMLHNERYTGVYIYGDVRIPGGVPQIISRELFLEANERNEAVKAEVRGRRRRDNVEYLLTGKLFCGYCREAMVGTCGTGKLGTMYYYYRCNNQAVAHTCPKKPVRKEVIERLVVSALKECVTQPGNIQWMTDMVMKYKQQMIDESDLGYLEAKLAENKKLIANVMKAIEMGVVTETTRARLQELEAEQKELLTSILAEKRAIPDITRDHAEFYFAQFRNGDVDDPKFRRTIVKHFLRAVYLYDDHLDIIFDYTDDDTPISVPIDIPTDADDPDLAEAKSVLISSDEVHHYFLIRTPARLVLKGRVFVLSIWFDAD